MPPKKCSKKEWFPNTIKFKMFDRCPYENKPDINHLYDLIYINNDDISDHLGWLCFPYFLVDKNKIIGIENQGKNILYGYEEKVKKILNYDINEYKNKISCIGKININKINKYKNDNIGYQYSLHLSYSLIKPTEINKHNIMIYNKTFDKYLEDLNI